MAKEKKPISAQREEAELETAYRNTAESKKTSSDPSSKTRTVTIIAICAAVVAVCIGIAAGYVYFSGGGSGNAFPDNTTIAGVDVGGMSKSEAIKAVRTATDNTYSQTDMVVRLLGNETVLSPAVTGAALDVKKAVSAAYEQLSEREGNAVDISSDYLSLNHESIREALEDLISACDTPLVESTYEIAGQQPSLAPDSDDTNGQVLKITMGTPQYVPELEAIYNQVLAAYNSNTFTVDATCSIIEPAPLDLDSIWQTHYVEPVDAVMDPETFDVSSESFGYAFDLESAKAMVAEAQYGETVEVPFKKLPPQVTAETLAEPLYRDVLGTYTATASSNADRNVNLSLACKSINGIILYPGDVFSYNEALGERTTDKGYKAGASYSGNETIYTVGGGICQVSSTLYYTALAADLEIVERYCHAFATGYMPLGLDATVNWGTLDFKFRNNTNYPIRIEASSNGGEVTVSLIGTDEKDYYVKMESEVINIYNYTTSYQVMPSDNVNGYKDGDVITTPYTGYDVNTYRCKYSKLTNSLISKDYEDISDYNKRDKVVCQIKDPEPTIAPTEPEPTETVPTEPETSSPVTGGGITEDGGGEMPPE